MSGTTPAAAAATGCMDTSLQTLFEVTSGKAKSSTNKQQGDQKRTSAAASAVMSNSSNSTSTSGSLSSSTTLTATSSSGSSSTTAATNTAAMNSDALAAAQSQSGTQSQSQTQSNTQQSQGSKDSPSGVSHKGQEQVKPNANSSTGQQVTQKTVDQTRNIENAALSEKCTQAVKEGAEVHLRLLDLTGKWAYVREMGRSVEARRIRAKPEIQDGIYPAYITEAHKGCAAGHNNLMSPFEELKVKYKATYENLSELNKDLGTRIKNDRTRPTLSSSERLTVNNQNQKLVLRTLQDIQEQFEILTTKLTQTANEIDKILASIEGNLIFNTPSEEGQVQRPSKDEVKKA